MKNVNVINWAVLVYLAAWCWADGFITTAFVLTVLASFEALWKPFLHSTLAVKLFGADTMAIVNEKSTTGSRQ